MTPRWEGSETVASCLRPIASKVFGLAIFEDEQVDPWKILNFLMLRQPIGSAWCWAAVTASVVLFFDHVRVCQCEVVNAVLNKNKCCKNIAPPPACEDLGTKVSKNCDEGARLEVALNAYQHFRSCMVGTPSLKTVQDEIDAGNPVLFRQSAAHFVVVDGYLKSGPSVQTQDPWNGSTLHPDYAGFAGACTHTYFTR